MAEKETKVARRETRTITADSNAPQRFGVLRRLWLPVALLLALAGGGLTGMIVVNRMNSSRLAGEIAALATYRPSVVTKVYADDGQTIIGEFALEKRIPLRHDEIPVNLKNAILAVEDTRFYQHSGIDPIRIAGAVWKNLVKGTKQGGSTLTQQLVKNLFLTREQTYTRKVNEWVMAIELERYYTKNQIMEMYVNTTFLGAGSYGFEAAAETYFGKQAKDLTLDEAALLAAIPRAPSQYSPTVNPEEARKRRNLVLTLMAENGLANPAEAEAAKARPIHVAESAYYSMEQRATPYDYPLEEIRKQLEERYTTRVAQGGLAVYSTVNVDAQKKIMDVTRERLRQYDRGRAKWRSEYAMIPTVAANGVPTQKELESYRHPHWYGNDFAEDSYIMGLVMSVNPAKDEAYLRFGNYNATLAKGNMGWGNRDPKAELKPGYLALVHVKKVDRENHRLEAELSQVPEVSAAMLTLNNHTGEIVAMSGGYDYQVSKFNNATQGLRQTGSAYKPFIYTAALEWGMTADSVVSGAPINKWGWHPHNYDGSLSHPAVPMKVALAKSYNIAAVHLLEMVGVQTGAQMARRFGITEPMAPFLPSALGASEVPLVEMVSAYSSFPNKGIRVEPHLIRKVLDRDGAVLEEWTPQTYKVTSEYVAGTMVEMMRGVVTNGTATSVQAVGVPIAGKTGTVNSHTDVWFIGYSPTYTTGVWMGHPLRKQDLGSGMTGGHGAAPYFIDFMKWFMKDKPRENFDKAPQMTEDIKELIEQRKREVEDENGRLMATLGSGRRNSVVYSSKDDEGGIRMSRITLPPPPDWNKSDAGAGANPDGGNDAVPEPPPKMDAPKPKPAEPDVARPPREPEGAKKKGKKGDEPPR